MYEGPSSGLLHLKISWLHQEMKRTMNNGFFERPILNSPYEYPRWHWELDAQGQPTQQIIEKRRRAEFITPIPKPKTTAAGKAIRCT